MTCQIASGEGFSYAWIDTCCIDKTSSAELSEAINSMFNWYARAEKCYVYLSDVESYVLSADNINRCRWITRGWTLQELIAPRSIEFYNAFWESVGSKSSLVETLSSCTRIHPRALSGSRPIHSYPVATRMSWAARRKTTRIEDMAYCLLGIFDVNMALLYGEEHKAFRRLQEEIIRTTDGLTILAWMALSTPKHSPKRPTSSLLASEPACFDNIAAINQSTFEEFLAEFNVIRKGVFISGQTPLTVVRPQRPETLVSTASYVMPLAKYTEHDRTKYLGIHLRKMYKNTYCWDRRYHFAGPDIFDFSKVENSYLARDFYIVGDVWPSEWYLSYDYEDSRRDAVRVPQSRQWSLTYVTPTNLWDEESRIFLKPDPHQPHSSSYLSLTLAMTFEGYIEDSHVVFMICCVWPAASQTPSAVFIRSHEHRRAFERLSDISNEADGVKYYDIEPFIPDLESGRDVSRMFVTVGKNQYEVSAAFTEATFSDDLCSVGVHELTLKAPKMITD